VLNRRLNRRHRCRSPQLLLAPRNSAPWCLQVAAGQQQKQQDQQQQSQQQPQQDGGTCFDRYKWINPALDVWYHKAWVVANESTQTTEEALQKLRESMWHKWVLPGAAQLAGRGAWQRLGWVGWVSFTCHAATCGTSGCSQVPAWRQPVGARSYNAAAVESYAMRLLLAEVDAAI